MTNATAITALLLDPRVQELLWSDAQRESEDFKALMEIVARTSYPVPLFVPLTTVITAVVGDAVLSPLIAGALAVVETPAMEELRRAAGLKESAA